MLRGSSVCTPQPWSTFAEKTEFTKGNLVSIYLIFAGLCLLGILYINRRLRLYLLQEKEKNEEMYRDGGRKSPGIIICYLVSQMSWYSSLFFSSRSTARYGISGAVYSALAGALAVSLMAPLAVQLKTKAPGARTFLQVIYARFGKWPHILFCTIALTINVTALLTLLTRATRGLIQNTGVTSEEVVLAVFIFVVGMGLTYGGISGIYTAAYIYVGFFLWFSLVLGCAVFLDPAKFPLGSFENIYDLINCQIGPEGNYNQSFLTFRSTLSALDTIEEFGTVLSDIKRHLQNTGARYSRDTGYTASESSAMLSEDSETGALSSVANTDPNIAPTS
nr:unnamed protein product [Spirometra erinaceieuropaei]